jgi:hypothetical protein
LSSHWESSQFAHASYTLEPRNPSYSHSLWEKYWNARSVLQEDWKICVNGNKSCVSSLTRARAFHIRYSFLLQSDFAYCTFLCGSLLDPSAPSVSSHNIPSLLLGNVVLLLEQVALDLGVLELLEISVCEFPKMSVSTMYLTNAIPHILCASAFFILQFFNSPLKCPHFSKWFTPSR